MYFCILSHKEFATIQMRQNTDYENKYARMQAAVENVSLMKCNRSSHILPNNKRYLIYYFLCNKRVQIREEIRGNWYSPD